MPLLSDKGLTKWILLQLWTHPSETVAALNAMLAVTTVTLIDGSTGKEFLFKTIPSECLPKLSADTVKLMENDLREWKKWLVVQGQTRMQTQYMQMQLQRHQNIQTIGLASQGAVLAQQQA